MIMLTCFRSLQIIGQRFFVQEKGWSPSIRVKTKCRCRTTALICKQQKQEERGYLSTSGLVFDVVCGANLGLYILQVRQRRCSNQRSWRTAFQRAWGFGCRTHHCNLLHFVSLRCRKSLARRGFGSSRAALSTLGILRNWRRNINILMMKK